MLCFLSTRASYSEFEISLIINARMLGRRDSETRSARRGLRAPRRRTLRSASCLLRSPPQGAPRTFAFFPLFFTLSSSPDLRRGDAALRRGPENSPDTPWTVLKSGQQVKQKEVPRRQQAVAAVYVCGKADDRNLDEEKDVTAAAAGTAQRRETVCSVPGMRKRVGNNDVVWPDAFVEAMRRMQQSLPGGGGLGGGQGDGSDSELEELELSLEEVQKKYMCQLNE